MQTPQPLPPKQAEESERNDNRLVTLLVILFVVVAILAVIVGVMILREGSGSQEAAATVAQPVTTLPTVPLPTVLPPTPAPQTPYGTANDYLNIRSGPGMEYPVYGVVAPGARSEIVGKSADNAWWAVKIPTSFAPDGIGWASASYVIVSGTPNVPMIPAPPPPQDINPPLPPANAVVVQTNEPVNVRTGPGNEYPSYGKVPAGTPLQAVGISQDHTWVAVSIPTTVAPSGIGWVNAAYLQPFDPASLPQMQP